MLKEIFYQNVKECNGTLATLTLFYAHKFVKKKTTKKQNKMNIHTHHIHKWPPCNFLFVSFHFSVYSRKKCIKKYPFLNKNAYKSNCVDENTLLCFCYN